jgi:pyruvate kinase
MSTAPAIPLPDEDLQRRLDGLTKALSAIRAEMARAAADLDGALSDLPADRRRSATNLVHYLTLRRHDLRALQDDLAALGLSSLGRAESHVLATVDAVLGALGALGAGTGALPAAGGPDFADGPRRLADETQALLGAATPGRGVRIMVTMPSEAASDYSLVHELVRHGMNVMRINCAHDAAPAWARMIEHLRRAERVLGVGCQVVMDLAGPKIRTGPLRPGPAVIKARPERDAFGRVTAPARVWLTGEAEPRTPPSPADAVLPVPVEWLSSLRAGDRVHLADARGARRALRVVDVIADGCWTELMKTTYFTPGLMMRLARGSREAALGAWSAAEAAIRLRPGDELILSGADRPGREATHDRSGRVLTPATIGCTMPEILADVRPGEPAWFDDGKIGGVITSVAAGAARIKITHAPPEGAWLGSDKGINLPDSQLHVPALTAKDIEDLAFVAGHADIVSLSFASSAGDVEALRAHLERLGGRRPGVILKIETRRGFEHLPEMLIAAMRLPRLGVMIARGDLAVECGFERLAEVQEEMLWICEAAHVPVIWATQVLERLAKSGMASRAEITDAAMGHRAECVMLNKGPHIVTALRTLDDILRRMEAHQTKKRAMLRELRLARAFNHGGQPPAGAPEGTGSR